MERRKLILAAVAGHLLLTALHGLVHAAIPVFPNGLTAAFAGVLLYLLPVAGAVLVASHHRRIGATFLCCAGIAGFVFEGTFHFLLRNPDHVAHVTAHQASFGVTAILTTTGNLLLVVAAWLSVEGTWPTGKEGRLPIER